MGKLDMIPAPSLKTRLKEALCFAEASDPDGVEAQTLRLVKCAMNDRDIKARGKGQCGGCSDDELLQLFEVMIQQREVSAKEYDDTGRIAEAEREREEIEILSVFLPKPLEGDALKMAVRTVVSDLGAKKLTDKGRCMTALRKRYPGRIECGPAGKAVQKALG